MHEIVMELMKERVGFFSPLLQKGEERRISDPTTRREQKISLLYKIGSTYKNV